MIVESVCLVANSSASVTLTRSSRVPRVYALDDMAPPAQPTRLECHVALKPRPIAPRTTQYGSSNLRFLIIPSLDILLRYKTIDAHTLVIFDIDCTLLQHTFDTVEGRARTMPVEGQTVQFVRALQACGVPVMGLTARMPQEADFIVSAMTRAGLDLRSTSPLLTTDSMSSKHPSAYRDGILFASDYNSKGEMLSLVHRRVHFSHALMVDDRVENFFSLAVAAKRSHFNLTCAFYLGAFSGQIPRSQSEPWNLLQHLGQQQNSSKVVWRLEHHAEAHRTEMLRKRSLVR